MASFESNDPEFTIHYHLALHKMPPLPFEFPRDPSPQLEVIRKWYIFLSPFDYHNLSNLMSDDFTHKTVPSSLGVPERTKNELFAYLGELQTNLKGQHLDVSRAQMTHSY